AAVNKDWYGEPLPPGAIKRLGTLRQRAPASTLAVTGDGKDVVAVNDHLAVRRFDALTGQLRALLQLPRNGDRALTLRTWVSPRARCVLACDVAVGACQLELWELAQGKRTQTLSLGQGMVRQAIFSADERFVAFAHFT